LKDDYDHLQKGPGHATIENTGFDIGDEEFLPDYFVEDAPTYKRNTVAINLPWLINGAPDIEIQTRFMGEQIFSRMKTHKNECLEHLFKVFRAVLLASADRDFDFMEQYCEEMLFIKLRNRLN
jgi:citrate lyase synthetase